MGTRRVARVLYYPSQLQAETCDQEHHTPRKPYRGYEQEVILVGIMDLNVNCDYWEF